MTDREKDDHDFPSKLTVYVVTCWILAAFGGFMFGYDIGISAVSSGAQNIWMLIIGRILLSFGVGFGNESSPKHQQALIERENETAGKSTLKKIRGVDNVNAEFEQIKAASEIAKKVKHPYKDLMKLSSMPPLIIGIMLQIFQQLTGIIAIMFTHSSCFKPLDSKTILHFCQL
ncbi:sugar transport protein [Salix suchowensis]|nr:sugar transport protein [Salix suchowensis]